MAEFVSQFFLYAWGPLGFIAAVYFYLKSKRITELMATTQSSTFFAKKHHDLEILYRGEPISSLGRSLVLLVNTGTNAIVKTQIPSGAPLTIRFNESVKLLSYEVVHLSEPRTGFQLLEPRTAEREGGGEIPVHFEHLNPGDGAVIELFFDCLESRGGSVRLEGVIINGSITSRTSTVSPLAALLAFILITACISSPAIGAALIPILAEKIGVATVFAAILFFAATGLVLFGVIRGYWWTNRKLTRLPSWVPASLSHFASSEVADGADGGPPLSDRHH